MLSLCCFLNSFSLVCLRIGYVTEASRGGLVVVADFVGASVREVFMLCVGNILVISNVWFNHYGCR